MGDRKAGEEQKRQYMVGDSAAENAKKKREMLDRDALDKEIGIADIFKRRNKMVRFPEGKDGDWKMLSEMREEIGEGLKSLSKEIRGSKRSEKDGESRNMKNEEGKVRKGEDRGRKGGREEVLKRGKER